MAAVGLARSPIKTTDRNFADPYAFAEPVLKQPMPEISNHHARCLFSPSSPLLLVCRLPCSFRFSRLHTARVLYGLVVHARL